MARLPSRLPAAALIGWVAGLSCATLLGTPINPPADAAVAPLVAQASQTGKASPYAAAKDEATTPASSASARVLEDLGGSRATGTTKDSPFAGAKESDTATTAQLRVDRGRLWWLLLPLCLAAISYAVLRGQDGEAA
ncbi:hypothetical protein [Synechococcus sp. GFB01]|uniref:hypothetical protein n=1 Tax=Synechococcus sp. GFB01 TaxID=1662190 RepID=UPI00064FE4D1|nr:hypothetical protein [Synechococcus sp. GFB01]KMM16724.1 hypothetical protein SYNGFB01_09110 [Synechococcus sp. GFB01]